MHFRLLFLSVKKKFPSFKIHGSIRQCDLVEIPRHLAKRVGMKVLVKYFKSDWRCSELGSSGSGKSQRDENEIHLKCFC